MFDERLLARAIPRPAQDTPARALDEIMHLAQTARYEAAARLAGELLDDGCKDLRAFAVYALAVFAERGPGAVPALFHPIAQVLSARPPAFAPSSPSARTADTALRFFFRTMKAHLEFEERKTAAARQPWSAHFASQSPDAVRRACGDLRKAVHEAIDAPRCEGELECALAKLEDYCAWFAPDARHEQVDTGTPAGDIEPEPPESHAGDAEPDDTEPDDPPSARNFEHAAFSRRATDHDADVLTLTVSPALRLFVRKLSAFEHLLRAGDLAKAAIVAHDVRQIVSSFDPMLYLPNLLSPHFRLLSASVDQLSPYMERSATPSWTALEQLYRVDLEAFLEA